MKKILLSIIGFACAGGLFVSLGHISMTEASTGSNALWDTGYMGEINDSSLKGVPGYTNFGKTFGTGNYRGAMPTSASIKILKEKYGITTIISLVPRSQMSKALQKAITDAKLTRIVIPLGATPPKKADWQKILTAFKSGHIFVHCLHGADRTGAVVARARVELAGVSADKAYKDMLTYNAKVEKIASYKKAFAAFKKFIYYGYSK